MNEFFRQWFKNECVRWQIPVLDPKCVIFTPSSATILADARALIEEIERRIFMEEWQAWLTDTGGEG